MFLDLGSSSVLTCGAVLGNLADEAAGVENRRVVVNVLRLNVQDRVALLAPQRLRGKTDGHTSVTNHQDWEKNLRSKACTECMKNTLD